MRLKDYIKDNILITDGAMGTYYSQLTGKDATIAELSNKNDPDIIFSIHNAYLSAGARLIRTNTFSANTRAIDLSFDGVKDLIERACDIAVRAIEGKNAFVAADIGPIPEIEDNNMETDVQVVLEEYINIADIFLNKGMDIFVFETFSSLDYIDTVANYIKGRNRDVFIMVQFALAPDGFTRRGISARRIMESAKGIPEIDAYGFNCGSGPNRMYSSIKDLDFTGDIVSVLPNAGYPEIINERTIYSQNPDYFSDRMVDFVRLGAKIVGGCCGTSPEHIQSTAAKLGQWIPPVDKKPEDAKRKVLYQPTAVNTFADKLKSGKFTIAVELDPPSHADIQKIMDGAGALKDNGVDIITISDSPMARARAHSLMLAARIKRELGIETLPHITCRDINIVGLKSVIIGAYTEGIRNILAVTGDPISSTDRNEIKSVFNLNSYKLIDLIRQMNIELFSQDPILIGGALNLNTRARDGQIIRMNKKIDNGASFFLTQPIYDNNVIDYLSSLKRKGNERILGGIMPIVSYRNARFLNNEMPGFYIPDDYMKRFNPDMTREEAEETGIELALETAKKLKDHVDGFYFVAPFNRVNMITRIINEL